MFNKSLINKIKLWICVYLSEMSVEESVKNDIVARININLQPSALYKFQKFLVGMALFPTMADNNAMKRLKWVNTVRNNMIHRGDLPTIKEVDFIRRAEITSSITFMLLAIVQYYFAKEIFGINNYLVEQLSSDVKNYFENGIFRGHNVFEESYEQFIIRQELEWIENGKRA